MNTVSLGVGFIAGLVASVLAWWAVALAFTPRLKVSVLNRFEQEPEIAPCGFRYRIKLINRSRHYAATDLSIHARLVVKGLDPLRPTTQTAISFPVGEPFPYPVLEARRRGAPFEDSERVYSLHIHELRGAALVRLPDPIRSRLEDRSITLEELLDMGSDAFIRLAVSACHSRSGFRRTYPCKFRMGDIEEGSFEDGSIQIRSKRVAADSLTVTQDERSLAEGGVGDIGPADSPNSE